MELLAQGHSNKEIGRVMGVSINTVKYHLKQIFGDLRVNNRARAVSQARELGIIERLTTRLGSRVTALLNQADQQERRSDQGDSF